ncbi:phosphoribosyltransferase [Mesobacillus campisalis]|uniref:Phosphoribosyltransferase n=1 Tax=Mesobacillus campisalis TaxID=1408103 RepID=A0A0M2T0N6_9BACI|nr:ComF family protein [Mesobacillus campisalis]KKK38802.1 phosphoribosyltransferase [Mesobacillus campisalis]
MDLFAGEYCLLCNAEVGHETSWTSVFLRSSRTQVCAVCQNKLKLLEGELCQRCGRVLEPGYREGRVCYDCLRWENDPEWQGLLSFNASIYHYNNFLKEVIARFKYRGDYALAMAFSAQLREKTLGAEADLLVPVPLSEERLYERGFNQSEALISAAGGEPVNLLSRVHGEKQSKKTRADRIHLPQVFQIIPDMVESIQGKRIVLVDDIYTTGSTLRHAAKMLRAHGAESVCSVTLAR